MKLVTYRCFSGESIGLWIGENLYDLPGYDPMMPSNMIDFLRLGAPAMARAQEIESALKTSGHTVPSVENFTLKAPVPNPPSLRDGYAFRQHVLTARRNRGLEMISAFDEYPVFYFSNHQAIVGPGPVTCMADHFEHLDFELEVAIIIGKKGRNISAGQADEHIAGFTILNDLSARTLQMEEMMLNLGPAKGKDFATCIGPWMVTPSELEQYKIPPATGHTGNGYQLEMICRVNNVEVSRGNMARMNWTFAELIERASYGCDLFPGDVIGSGTVGTGCFLEINGSKKLVDPGYLPQWLAPNDRVDLEVDGLGTLTNTMIKDPSDWSILRIKKTIDPQ